MIIYVAYVMMNYNLYKKQYNVINVINYQDILNVFINGYFNNQNVQIVMFKLFDNFLFKYLINIKYLICQKLQKLKNMLII